jgi:adenosylmethionine-8-amino-7-oxononanoate aminotransferase
MNINLPRNSFDTAALTQKDKAHHVHPWQHFATMAGKGPVIIASADGVHLEDTEGRRYLDGIAGMWCVNAGYGRHEIVQAMAEQAMRLPYTNTFTDVSNPPAAELSAKLAELAPEGLNHVCFTTSGSAGNDTTVRLAHFYHARRGKPSKRHVICRMDAYHGSTYLAASLGKRAGDRSPHLQYEEDWIHHLSSPNPYRRPAGVSEDAFLDVLVAEFEAKIAELGADNIALFLAEPVQGSGGVIVPPAGYHAAFKKVCDDNDILYAADEVVTAFGRLGHFFASQDEYGMVPDIIITAKGLTSAYFPMGAVLFSDAMYDAMATGQDDQIDPGTYFPHGFTFSGHPIGCAAALKNIEIIEKEDILRNAREVGDYFETRMKSLADLPLVGDVRGRRLMMCVEYVADKQSKELLPDDVNISKRIVRHCERNGLMVRPIAHLNVLSPPLTITRDHVDQIVDTLGDAVKQVAAELG